MYDARRQSTQAARWISTALACTGAAFLVGPAVASDAVTAERVDAWVTHELDRLVATYRDLHAHPELSLEESETARRVANALAASGYKVTTGVGGTGVVGILANGDGPVVLVRGDMDALPVTEDTGLPYASRVTATRSDGTKVGVMHACGHDIHTTALIAVAALLSDQRAHWRGTLIALAQPAEEVGKGALMMIEDGLFERFPRPDHVLSLHVDARLPAGRVAVVSGWATANVDTVDIHIRGRGGHGARPHRTVDPIVTAAYLVTALQTIVSRRVDPIEPAVVTVGSIHGGSKHNVIPDEVHLQLTVRSYSDAVRDELLGSIRRIAVETCRSFECPEDPTVAVKKAYTPAAYNDPALAAAATALFREILGADNVVELPASMGGEDFGRYARVLGVPGLQFRLGSVARARWNSAQEPGGAPLPTLHSSGYTPDPAPTLRTGITALARLTLSLLAPAR